MRKVISLCYHDLFEEDDCDVSGLIDNGSKLYKIKQQNFKIQLELISEIDNLDIVSVLDFNSKKVFGSNHNVLLTFDDGGSSAYSKVFPLLEEFGLVGHFFIIGNRIGKKGFVNATQLREMRKFGHVIGTHSFTHPTVMSDLSYGKMEDEWTDGVRALEDILGESIITASIPNGYSNNKVIDAAIDAGIRYIFTSNPTLNILTYKECSVIGRYPVQSFHDNEYVASISQGKAAAIIKHTVEWRLKKILRLIGGKYYLRVRDGILSNRFSK